MKTFVLSLFCVACVSAAVAADVDSYEKILATGDAKECVALAKVYYDGAEVTQDYEKAARLYHTAATEGNAEARYMMSLMYSEGTGVKERPDKAFAWAYSAANMGHVDAANLLGFYYSQGYGVARDEKLATLWFEKAAVKGSAKAQFNLGSSYDLGLGVPPNPSLAVDWYGKAASQGDPRGQLALGNCFEIGKGVVRNKPLAVAWYKKAAEQDYTPAQLKLAKCYEKGIGVAIDPAAAASLYREASESGNPGALLEYGFCLELGKGVEKEETLAREMYTKAAEAGVALAKQRLAYLDWDDEAAASRAEGMKATTLVFKGLYLGMPIQDAAITLEKRLREMGQDEMIFVQEENPIQVIRKDVNIEVIAKQEGLVDSIYLSNRAADRLFDTADSSNPEFIKTFVDAYDIKDAVQVIDNSPIFNGGKPVGSQKRFVYRHSSGYELSFYDSYAFHTIGTTESCLATGACKPVGSFSIKKIASEEERAANFN